MFDIYSEVVLSTMFLLDLIMLAPTHAKKSEYSEDIEMFVLAYATRQFGSKRINLTGSLNRPFKYLV